MSTFTKSPWIIKGDITDAQNGDIAIGTGKGTLIALAYKSNTANANAHLIAAAPDTYEALEVLLNRYDAICDIAGLDKDNPASNKARKALKKARGE